MNIIKNLEEKKLITPPKWLADNTHYLTITGSKAYGSSHESSDEDIYGFAIPPKHVMFPTGDIPGFDKPKEKFEQYLQTAIKDNEKEYDFTVFNIAKYFRLCADGNPNMIDTLFTPQDCVLHCTELANNVRENRRLFLSKECYFKFAGYSKSQLHKMKIKTPQEGGKRWADIQKHGFDCKFGVHLVRLLLEAKQILEDGDLDLRKNSELLKEIRRGEWTEDQVINYFEVKDKELRNIFESSKLQNKPDEAKIRQLLVDCLEHHFGNLSSVVVNVNAADEALAKIKEIVNKF